MNFRFIVNKESGFTKVFATRFKSISEELCNDQSIRPVAFIVANIFDGFKSEDNREITSCTRCSKSDEYDEVLGRDIAESKVSLKYHKMMISDYKRLIKKMEFFVENLYKKLEYHEKIAKNISDNFNERYLPKE